MTSAPASPTRTPLRARLVSVVLPMHNERDGLDRLFGRLVPVLESLGAPFEIVCVDDGSRDDTWARLKEARARVPNLKIVTFSRNFGKEIAVTAGLAHTKGDVVIVMDSDLQHPPEAIPDLVAHWNGGDFDVVFARRVDLDRGTFLRNAFSQAFYRAFDYMSEISVDRETGDFGAYDRKVIDAFLAMPERNRFNRGLFAWAGFRTTTLPVTMEERQTGASSWGFVKLVRLAIAAITSFGTLPLKIWAVIGTIVSLSSLLYGAWVVMKTLIFGADVPGFPSLMVAILFFSGIQLVGLGIIGEYLGQVFFEVKRRPLYFVRETHGFDETPAAPAAAPQSHPTETRG
ncbi:MAG: glycosyltransferase family 2 protein [Hyphomicrobiales bacterium]|nr:glycosyltransferase family 2 protein [Hyphomicrobiales bacterium]